MPRVCTAGKAEPGKRSMPTNDTVVSRAALVFEAVVSVESADASGSVTFGGSTGASVVAAGAVSAGGVVGAVSVVAGAGGGVASAEAEAEASALGAGVSPGFALASALTPKLVPAERVPS